MAPWHSDISEMDELDLLESGLTGHDRWKAINLRQYRETDCWGNPLDLVELLESRGQL